MTFIEYSYLIGKVYKISEEMIFTNLNQVFIENKVALICDQNDAPSSHPKRLPKYLICILEIGRTLNDFLVYTFVK